MQHLEKKYVGTCPLGYHCSCLSKGLSLPQATTCSLEIPSTDAIILLLLQNVTYYKIMLIGFLVVYDRMHHYEVNMVHQQIKFQKL